MTPADGSAAERGCPTGLAPVETDAGQGQIDPVAFVRTRNGEHSLDVLVRGAKCGGCLSKIEGGIRALQGVKDVRMNLTTGRLRVSWTDGDFNPSAVLSTLTSLGYGATPYDADEAGSRSSRQEKRLLAALAVAGFAMANIMLLSVSVWSGGGEMGEETRTLMHWVSAAIAIPAVAFAGRPFFTSAIDALGARRVNMDVPISLAVLLAVGMSLYQTLTHGEEAYFDAAVMLLFFLLIGRFLDARLQRETQSAARDLAALQAVSVTRIGNDGAAESVRASELTPGDLILVAPGERFSVDAEIVGGVSDLDLRMTTGETRPSPAAPGEIVYSGALNITSSLQARVINASADSMLAEIGKILDAGELKRSRYRQIADHAARLYVPIVHTLAALTFLGWLLLRGDLETAVFTAISVLIITCPCALALAAPVVQVVAVGRLFRKGVYLKSGDALERIADCDVVIFDKTGTLTRPDPVWDRSETALAALEKAAILARGSRHPYSRALVREAGPGPVAEDIREYPGKGVEATVDGVRSRLGSATWIGVTEDENAAAEGALWFRQGETDPVPFVFAESLHSNASEMTAELKARGVEIEILSGDAPNRVETIARALGVDTWQARMSPADKAARLDVLESEGRRVLMIGDGLNDAGALARALASLTPGGAVDISRSASDGVYSADDMLTIVDVIDTAVSSRRRMLENFSLAAIYNCLAIPLAVLGLVTPLIAAIAMSGSSLIVTLNALRLNIEKPRRIAS